MRKLLFLFALELFANSDFESYKKSIQKEFQNYYEKEMKAFESYKKTADGIEDKINPYQEMSVLPTKEIKKEPPKEELIREKNIEKPNTPSGSQTKTVDIETIDEKSLIAPEKPVIPVAVVEKNIYKFEFFGREIEIEKSSIEFVQTVSKEKDIAKLGELIRSKNSKLANQVKRYKNSLDLNDWDSIIFVQTLINNLYKKDEDLAKTVHAVELIRELGFKARIAEGKSKKPYLLLALKQDLYSKGFTTKDNQKFYIFAIDSHPRASFSEPIYFYKSPDDNKGRLVDMIMNKDPKIGEQNQAVKLSWDYKQKNHQIVVNANRQLANLMDMYPQVDYAIYMQSNSGARLIKEVSIKLAEKIVDLGLDEKEAVNFVLRFVQHAFAYKTDFEAYGYERPVFVEQAVLLPYSDCEDRATMLSQFYRAIFGYESRGLKYIGHMALAVDYRGDGKDFLNIENRKFFVVEGSYFYVNAGVAQPDFVGVKPTVLPTR